MSIVVMMHNKCYLFFVLMLHQCDNKYNVVIIYLVKRKKGGSC